MENRPTHLLGAFLFGSICVAIFNRLFTKDLFPTSSFYESPYLVFAAVNAAIDYHPAIAVTGLGLLTLIFAYFVIRFNWLNLCSSSIRWFVLFMALLVVWRQSTYGFNYFVDVSHAVDRLILIALFLLSFWRPAFLVLLPVMVFLMQGQLSVGYLSYTSAEFSMPLKIIVGFCSLMLVGLFSTRRFDSVFVWLAVVVIMAHYWTSAYAKILINWHEFGQIHYMLAASYAGGWLNFVGIESISAMLKNLSRFDKVAMAFTLLFESLVIFSLFKGSLLVVLLLCAALFHIVVVAVSGIWFWQWLLVDFAFIYFLFIKSDKHYLDPVSFPLFSRVIATIVIVSTPFWAGAPRLGWHDSPVSYIYQVRAYDADNNATVLTPAYFTPYVYPLTLNSLQFLSDSKSLPISWGSSRDLSLVKTLATASTSEQILELIEQQGTVYFDAERAQGFDDFIKTFVMAKQKDARQKYWFDFVSAPDYLYTSFQSRQYVDSVIERVEVHRVISWFDGTTMKTIDATPVRTITINVKS